MTYAQNFTDATNTAYLQRVTSALIKAANNIVGESSAGPTHLAKDAKRHALAVTILNQAALAIGNVHPLAGVFALSMLTAASGTTSDTDGQIDTEVSSVFNNIAGVGISD